MNERCGAPRNIDFGDNESDKPEIRPEILSDSSRAYIQKMSSMNEASAKALQPRLGSSRRGSGLKRRQSMQESDNILQQLKNQQFQTVNIQ